MRSTSIVTSFITNEQKILILKRSNQVKTLKCLWAGISGIIEKGDKTPLSRAKIEIFEEVGIKEEELKLLKSIQRLRVVSPQYKNHEWGIFPFLFSTKNMEIKLNWENSEFRWIKPTELVNYKTVPDLDKILSDLL